MSTQSCPWVVVGAVVIAAVSLGACHRPDGGSSTATSGTALTMPPSSTATPKASAPAAASKAVSTINGKSLSDATDSDVQAAMKKAGWSYGGGSTMTMGAVTTISLTATKGSAKAKVTLIKPSGKANDPNSGMRATSPAEAEKDYAAKGAAKLDGDSLLAVVIDGRPDDSKALLGALLDK